jgi:hypothetical protein
MQAGQWKQRANSGGKFLWWKCQSEPTFGRTFCSRHLGKPRTQSCTSLLWVRTSGLFLPGVVRGPGPASSAPHCSKSCVLLVLGGRGTGKSSLARRLRSLVETSRSKRRETDSDDDADADDDDSGAEKDVAAGGSSTDASLADVPSSVAARSCLRYSYFASEKSGDHEALRAGVHVWRLGDLSKPFLLRQARAAARRPIVLLTVDVSNPWTLGSSLEQVRNVESVRRVGSPQLMRAVRGCSGRPRFPWRSLTAPHSQL